jgi:hypothetical protein
LEKQENQHLNQQSYFLRTKGRRRTPEIPAKCAINSTQHLPSCNKTYQRNKEQHLLMSVLESVLDFFNVFMCKYVLHVACFIYVVDSGEGT